MAVSSSKYRTEILRPFQGKVRADTPQLLAHWIAFKRDGNPESLTALVANYLPNARLMALRLCRIQRRLFPELAESLSTATVALYDCIGSFEPDKNPESIAGFVPYYWVWGQKKCRFLARRDRNDGKLAVASTMFADLVRNQLTSNLGRNPTPEEIIQAFGGRICDAAFYARPIPRTIHASNVERGDDANDVDILGSITGREPAPHHAMLQHEMKLEFRRRIMRDLSKREKRIIRQIMSDEPLCHLGHEMNVSRQRVDQIAKRLLKKLAARKSLSGYFEIKAAPEDGAKPQLLKAAA
jgi:RNA polymerase sigma factor (sigma-70 family)